MGVKEGSTLCFHLIRLSAMSTQILYYHSLSHTHTHTYPPSHGHSNILYLSHTTTHSESLYVSSSFSLLFRRWIASNREWKKRREGLGDCLRDFELVEKGKRERDGKMWEGEIILGVDFTSLFAPSENLPEHSIKQKMCHLISPT